MWIFDLYLVTFQQHLNVEYICHSRSDIPEIVVPIMISFIDNCCRQCTFGSYDDFLDIILLLTKKLLSQGFLGVKFESPLRKLKVTTMIWLTAMEYLFNKRPQICFACRNHNTVLYSFMTFYRVFNKSDMKEQELFTIPGRLSSPPCFNKVHVPRSLVLCVMFCWSLIVLLFFFFWSLSCMYLSDLQLLITPLVFSNCSSSGT